MAGVGPNQRQGGLTSSRHKLLKVGALPTSEAAQYTAPVGQSVKIESASVCNTTAGALTLTLSVIAKATTPGDTNRLYKALSVAAGATTVLDALEGMVIADEDFISGVASGAGITLTLTGTVYGG